MQPRRHFLASFLSIPALAAADEKEPAFRVKLASEYPSKQTSGAMVAAAVKFETDEECRAPFGKVNPNEYGFLPVLLVIENKGDKTLMLDSLQVYYQAPGVGRIEPTPPQELRFAIAPKRPNTGPGYPVPIPLPKKKNPLTNIGLETRAWAAKLALKGESVSGFFYFQTRLRRNAFLYVTGVREAVTNQELFYVEIPFDTP